MTDQIIVNPTPVPEDEALAAAAKFNAFGDITSCCRSTIEQLVRDNPMMVCGECKNIIKCFQDDRSFHNYLTFCKSRRRPVVTGMVNGYWTIAFRSYNAYGR